jgi:hypothetical protein
LAVIRNVVQQLVQGQALDLLGLHVTARVVEVENNVALIDLLHEELLALVRGHLVESGQFLQVSRALIRDVEARRVLPLGRSNTLDSVLWSCLQAIEYQRLGTGFRRGKIARHRFGRAGRGYVLVM